MKYVYAVLTVLEENPIMQTLVSNSRLTGRQVLDKVVLNSEEREKYKSWNSEEEILKDMNNKISIKVEIQEVEVN
ncbi:MAG: hypothetical protein PHP06_04390 [Clostridia bacterium]|nr:hypothetical protein [Clostridia bacterium]